MIPLLLSIPSRILDIIGDWLTPDLGPSREPATETRPAPVVAGSNGICWSDLAREIHKEGAA